MSTSEAPGTAAMACSPREGLRACRVTEWPWATRERAMFWPIPSEEPVMRMRDMVSAV